MLKQQLKDYRSNWVAARRVIDRIPKHRVREYAKKYSIRKDREPLAERLNLECCDQRVNTVPTELSF